MHLYACFFAFISRWGSPCGVVANVLDCDIVVSKFELCSLLDKYSLERYEALYPFSVCQWPGKPGFNTRSSYTKDSKNGT